MKETRRDQSRGRDTTNAHWQKNKNYDEKMQLSKRLFMILCSCWNVVDATPPDLMPDSAAMRRRMQHHLKAGNGITHVHQHVDDSHHHLRHPAAAYHHKQQRNVAEDSGIRKIQPFTVELVEPQQLAQNNSDVYAATTTTQETRNFEGGVDEAASSSSVLSPLSYFETTTVRTVLEDLVRSYLSMKEPDWVVTYAAITRLIENDVTTTTTTTTGSETLDVLMLNITYRLTFEGAIYFDTTSSTGLIPTETDLLGMIISEALTPSAVTDAILRTMTSSSIQSAQVVVADNDSSSTIPTTAPAPAPVASSNGGGGGGRRPTGAPTIMTAAATPAPVEPTNSPTTTVTSSPTLAPVSVISPTLSGEFTRPSLPDLQTSPPVVFGITEGQQTSSSNPSSSSSPGLIGGLVAAIAVLLVVIFLFVKSRRQKQRNQTPSRLVPAPAETPDDEEERGEMEKPGSGKALSWGWKTQSSNQYAEAATANTSSSPPSSPDMGSRSRTHVTSLRTNSTETQNATSSPGERTKSTTEMETSNVSDESPVHISSRNSASAIAYLSTLFRRNNLNNGSNGAIDVDAVAPELLRDDLSSIHSSSDDGCGLNSNRDDTFDYAGEISDFDDNISIQPHFVVPVSSLQRTRQKYIVKKDMLESPIIKMNPIRGDIGIEHLRANASSTIQKNSNQNKIDGDLRPSKSEEEEEAMKKSMIPSHYFRRPYNSDDMKPRTEKLSSFLKPTNFSAATLANVAETSQSNVRRGKYTSSSLSTSDMVSSHSPTKSMLPKFSPSWWAARSSSSTSKVNNKVIDKKDGKTSSAAAAAAAAAATSDIESDGDNTTFRAASSDGWDPNDSQMSGSIGTHEDGFVVHNGIGDVGQPKQAKPASQASGSFLDDVFPSSKTSTKPKSLLRGARAKGSEVKDSDRTSHIWKKDDAASVSSAESDLFKFDSEVDMI
jgi:hypothetical protein